MLRRQEQLRDLDRVQRRALAQVVAGDEEREAVLDRRVLADPADEHVVAARGAARRRELLERDARRAGEDRGRLLGGERLAGLEPDRLRVADQHGDAHARRAHRQRRQLEDLARLLAQLLLLLELDAVEAPVHPQVELVRRLPAELLHRLRPRAGDRLVGGDADAYELRRVVQRLQRAGERDRAAVRVGDDAVVLGGADAVHLRDDERHAGLEPVRRRLVDRDRAAADGVRDELAAGGGADGEETEVEVAGGERLRRRLLDDRAAELGARRARGREQAHVVVAALAQELERDRPDRAGRADDADPGPISQARTPRGEPARRGRRRSTGRGRRS